MVGGVTALLENLKGPIELGNPNTCAEVKLCIILFIPAQKKFAGRQSSLNTRFWLSKN